MRIYCSMFLLIATLFANAQSKIAIAIHAGAGVMDKKNISDEQMNAYTAKLDEALNTGYNLLQDGASSIDAVEAAIRILEDSPLFNAGKGAVLNENGGVELDASIMDGKSLLAGAVAGVKTIRNPITAAKLVMQRSKHVMLAGRGAEEFAIKEGAETADSVYFFDQKRYDAWERLKKMQKLSPDKGSLDEKQKHGTVGAVALDKDGNLAAGTSTGGMMMKKYGRIGDSPIIGAGTYADNKTCAVSCTGHGEYFIRLGVAHDVSMQMEYLKITVDEAAANAVNKVEHLGGTGGLIAMDAKGNIAIQFNTQGLFRGYIDTSGRKKISVFKD